MQSSNAPGKLVLPFASAGGKNTIPTASQIGIVAGKASLTDGFPPLTRTPLSAGGVPPSGLDMNGILYEMSNILRWANAGGGYAYDSTFANDSHVGGYPKGARVMRSDGMGYWFNTVDNNDTDPEAPGAAAAGWVPDYQAGAASVVMSGSSVILTPAQYGKPLIVITGTLSANLNLIFPTLAQGWTIINNTTGDYSITAKTASGSGVALGTISQIVGDGTNIYAANPDNVQIVTNVETLRNIAPNLSRRMQTKGYYTDGDGGNGQYFGKVGAAPGTYVDNGGTIIVPNGGDGSAAWLLDINGYSVSVKQFGAVANGTTDDRQNILDADAVGSFSLPAGTYKIGSDTTFTNVVVFSQGAKILVPNGVTVTFNGGVDAGIYRIFECVGSGKVTFQSGSIGQGYAEWWGAVPNINTALVAAANTSAFNAALIALPKVIALAADYYHDGTIIHQTPGVKFIGAGSRYDTIYGPRPTRLLLTSSSMAVLQIGPSANPGAINQFPRGIRAEDIWCSRVPAPDAVAASPAILVKYVLDAEINRVGAAESIYGFHFIGTVASRAIDCSAIRSVAGVSGADSWRGFYIDGITDVIAAGGNASLYLVRPSAACNLASLQTGNSHGFYLDGAFTDAFLIWPETVNCRNGISVNGNGAVGNSLSNTDLHISHPVMDQFHNAGIFVTNVAEAGSFSIDEPYFGPATDARVSLWISGCPGGGSVRGGQFVHGASQAQPIIIENSSGVIIDEPQILESGNTYGAISLDACNNCIVRPKMKNKSVTSAAAIQLFNSCNANTIAPLIMGKVSAFTLGIQVIGAGDNRNEYGCTGIDSSCIAGGSANKLTRNGVQITATGISGTNLVSGVMS